MSDGSGGTGEGVLQSGASVSLTPNTEWINECFPADGRHLHVSVYLVRSDGHNIVIDSGSFHHRKSIETRLREATEGEGIHTLILSHTDYPHSGNVSSFRREWGDIQIVASSGAPEIQGLPYADKASIGGSMEIGGRTFSFIDPPLADRSHTSWVHDDESGILYTADGFGSHHDPGQCSFTSADFPDGIPAEIIYEYHREALPWLRYVDPDKLERKLDGIFAHHEVSWVAPIHGHPIAAADIDRYRERLVEAAARISREYRVPGR